MQHLPRLFQGRIHAGEAKMATFEFYGLNYYETVEDRWAHAVML